MMAALYQQMHRFHHQSVERAQLSARDVADRLVEEEMTVRRQLSCLICILGIMALFTVGCSGDEGSAKPTISSPEINCGDPPSDSYVDVQVVRELSVKIEDPDRDLLSVTANINGYAIQALTDDDADQRFNWTPENTLDPMICKGQISIQIKATDAEGNISVFSDVITK